MEKIRYLKIGVKWLIPKKKVKSKKKKKKQPKIFYGLNTCK